MKLLLGLIIFTLSLSANASSKCGTTTEFLALLRGVEKGNFEPLRKFVNEGGDPDLCIYTIPNRANTTPLKEIASLEWNLYVKSNGFEFAKFLLAKGAKPSALPQASEGCKQDLANYLIDNYNASPFDFTGDDGIQKFGPMDKASGQYCSSELVVRFWSMGFKTLETDMCSGYFASDRKRNYDIANYEYINKWRLENGFIALPYYLYQERVAKEYGAKYPNVDWKAPFAIQHLCLHFQFGDQFPKDDDLCGARPDSSCK